MENRKISKLKYKTNSKSKQRVKKQKTETNKESEHQSAKREDWMLPSNQPNKQSQLTHELPKENPNQNIFLTNADKIDARIKETKNNLNKLEAMLIKSELLKEPKNDRNIKSEIISNKEELSKLEKELNEEKSETNKEDCILSLLHRKDSKSEDLSVEQMIKDEKKTTLKMYDVDLYQKISGKTNKSETKTKEIKKRIINNTYLKTQETLENCGLCFGESSNQAFAKNTMDVVALGYRAYLALPNVTEVVRGHCYIVPIEHVGCSLDLDDETWTEIRNFQKCLIKMFDKKNYGTLFMETYYDIKSYEHCIIECIPLKYTVFYDAPRFYKEALLSCDEEWSNNRKIIETTDKGFRNTITSKLEYFHVWFNINGGYAHIIEGSRFKKWLGKEVIAGMLNLDISKWRNTKFVKKEVGNNSRIKAFVDTFDWKSFDWTDQLV